MFGEGGDKYTKGLHDGSGEVQVLASRGTGIYSNDDYKSYLRGQGLNWDKWFWDLMRSGDRWAQNGGTESLGRSIASLNSLVNFGNAYTGYTSGANIYGESIGKGQATVELASGFLGMVPGGAGGKALVAEEGILLAKYSGILRDAAKFKGNFGLGKGTASEALELGKAWVGKGYTTAGNGKILISKNGLRQFRVPSYKPKLGIHQANFEWRNMPHGQWQGNGHLDIIK